MDTVPNETEDEILQMYSSCKMSDKADSVENINDILIRPGNDTVLGQKSFYLALNNEKNLSIQTEIISTSNSNYIGNAIIHSSDEDSLLTPNSKIGQTLNHTKMLMTSIRDGDNDENYEAIEPHLLTENSEKSNDSSTSLTTFNNEPNNSSIIQHIPSTYHVLHLEDGTEALIKLDESLRNEIKPCETPPIIATTSNRKFTCNERNCGQSFSSLQDLTKHMIDHTDLRPYKCTVSGCGKEFVANYSLKAHSRVHSGERPFNCCFCSKSFKTSGDVQKHIRSHTGERPFPCPVIGCGKSFSTTNIRKVHIRSHTGERPYACDYPDCGKAFTSVTNYKNHLRIHSGEKPYVCSAEGCAKRFTEYSSLYKHSFIHLQNRQRTCPICHEQFKLEHTLHYHTSTVHGMILQKNKNEMVLKIK